MDRANRREREQMRYCSFAWTFEVGIDSQGIVFGDVPSPPMFTGIRYESSNFE